MNILQINSSARRVYNDEGSYSTRLSDELSAALAARYGNAQITVRDVGLDPVPSMDEAALGALFTPAEARNVEQAARVAQDDMLIAELLAHDIVVIAAPMINFGVPSQLKNWIDAVARAGITFRYGPSGYEGLVKDKKVYVVTTRGGIHRDQPTDSVTPHLRTVLGFLGMTDVEFIFAEGLAKGPDAEAAGLAAARAQIAELTATVLA